MKIVSAHGGLPPEASRSASGREPARPLRPVSVVKVWFQGPVEYGDIYQALVRDGNGNERMVYGLTERPQQGDKLEVEW